MNKTPVLAAGILSAVFLAGQSLQFEVATVMPHVRQGAGPIIPQTLRVEPSRLRYSNASLMACIQAAYGIPREGLPDYRLVGGPDWLSTVRFDIEAIANQPVSKEQMMLMLESLLAERFQLKVHRETKELRVYALTVGKNSSKLVPAKDEEREALVQRRREDPPGASQELVVQKNSIARFTKYLSRQFDQPGIDKTGLNGDFSFTLHWVPDVNRLCRGWTFSDPPTFTLSRINWG
jgi:uncharacterized protein (TIGR03435 family)